jgi:hypothetical protein
MTNQPIELESILVFTSRWYEETKNPLYVWQAMNECFHAEEPLPDWCLDYLKDAAQNLYSLSCGVDFRTGKTAEKISPDEAVKLVTNALSISRQGKKNAFASLRVDAADARAAQDDYFRGKGACVERLGKETSVTRERVLRRAARGRRLIGGKGKTSL